MIYVVHKHCGSLCSQEQKEILMRVIYTFNEIKASQKLMDTIVSIIDRLSPEIGDSLSVVYGSGDPIGNLEQITREFPGFIKVDYNNQNIIISIPPDVMVSLMEESTTWLTSFETAIMAVWSLIKTFMPMMKSSQKRSDKIIEDFLDGCRSKKAD